MRADVISSHDMVRIAAEAVLSTQTVRRYLRGESVTDNTKTRIRQALKALGFKDPAAAPDVACRHTAHGGDDAAS